MVLLSTEYPQFMFWLQNKIFFNMHANLKAWIQTTHQTALNDQSDLVFQPNISDSSNSQTCSILYLAWLLALQGGVARDFVMLKPTIFFLKMDDLVTLLFR